MTSSSSSFPSSSKAFSTSKLYEVIKGVIRGREMPFPEQRADPCNSGNIYPSCPIVKGEKYQFKAWFEVKPFYPPVSAPTLLMAQGESGNQFPLLLTNNYHCSFVPPLPPSTTDLHQGQVQSDRSHRTEGGLCAGVHKDCRPEPKGQQQSEGTQQVKGTQK